MSFTISRATLQARGCAEWLLPPHPARTARLVISAAPAMRIFTGRLYHDIPAIFKPRIGIFNDAPFLRRDYELVSSLRCGRPWLSLLPDGPDEPVDGASAEPRYAAGA